MYLQEFVNFFFFVSLFDRSGLDLGRLIIDRDKAYHYCIIAEDVALRCESIYLSHRDNIYLAMKKGGIFSSLDTEYT